MLNQFTKRHIAVAVAAAIGAAAAGAAVADSKSSSNGTYVAGDVHNHTTCSDGSISMQKLIKKATDKQDTPWGLDWFVQAGHGGNGNRNCTLIEDASLATPAYPVVTSLDGTKVLGPTTTWQNSIPAVQPKGLVSGAAPNQNMWRWQSIQEYQYPVVEYLSALRDQPLFIGIESVVAGHEHTSASVISGQMPNSVFKQALPTSAGYTALGNATALAKWEYCFDRGDTDTGRGNTVVGGSVGNNWDCSVPGSANAADPNWSPVAQKLIPVSGAGVGSRGHLKTVEAVKWMAAFHGEQSYYLPTHLERAGPFNPDGNNGFNIENLRNFNNAAPNVAFGFETQPGHGASDARGEYTIRRNNIAGTNVDSVGGTTWGGTGVYGAQVGGVWDALLGEGRNYWFFASSDWHNRGSFGPDDRRSSQDFYPGEYQRSYVKVKNNTTKNGLNLTPQNIVNGMRTGNIWSSAGQLIDRLSYVVCASSGRNSLPTDYVAAATLEAAKNNTDVDVNANCATMGEKLVIKPGQDVVVAVTVRDPSGTNYSPYSFPNPSLAQVGISTPVNAPVLDHVDVIRGLVTGYKTPGAADYSGEWPRDWINNPNLANVPAAAKNTSAAVIRTFSNTSWASDGEYKTVAFTLEGLSASQYLRLRGSNLPASVPYETDADGNPLQDLFTNAGAVNPTVPGGADGQPAGANLRIPCNTVGTNVPAVGTLYTGAAIDGCPSHLPVINGQKYSAFDVAAWSDLWFYSNPVYIEVKGSTLVAGVK
ncbi:MAG TPA: hypothetical protein VMF52_16345 [Steroidobacteraceae bacterium]|nr:hypothetical protein [Steroidobacteraceae bacterium]